MAQIIRYALACALAGLGACATPPIPVELSQPASPTQFSAAIGDKVRVGAAIVTPLAIVEDSRCPLGVTCIQAGTVRLRAEVRRDASAAPAETVIVGLKSPVVMGGNWLHLVEVVPYPRQPGQIAPVDYRFIFSVTASADRQ